MIPYYEYNTQLIRQGRTDILNFPLHIHGGPELLRLRSGRLKVQIQTKEYLVESGDLVIIFPNTIHSYQTLSAPKETYMELLILGQDTKNGFPKKLSGSILADPVKQISSLHPDIDYLFSSLFTENELSLQPDRTQLISAILQLFWLRLLPDLSVMDSTQSTTSDLPTALISYISEHFCEPLSLEQLSRELGVCRFYLSRTFTQVLHTGFYEYVNALRVDQAKKILRTTQDSVLDVAIQCGFQNQQTFNRIFKKLCHMTPSAYRNRKD